MQAAVASVDTEKLNSRVAKAVKSISPAELEAAVASLGQSTNNNASTVNIAQEAPIVPSKSDLMVDEATDQSIGVELKVAEDAALALKKASIAVVSPGGDEGSNVVLHLARTLASQAKRVIVLDLTGTNVTLSNMIGDAYVPGLGEFLTGDADLSKVVLNDKYSTAKILGAGNLTNETLSNNLDNLKRLANLFYDANDYVIFDCGPIGVNGLSKIANEETIVFIPTLGTNAKTCLKLEQQLIETGFDEAVVINCNADERKELQYAASA